MDRSIQRANGRSSSPRGNNGKRKRNPQFSPPSLETAWFTLQFNDPKAEVQHRIGRINEILPVVVYLNMSVGSIATIAGIYFSLTDTDSPMDLNKRFIGTWAPIASRVVATMIYLFLWKTKHRLNKTSVALFDFGVGLHIVAGMGSSAFLKGAIGAPLPATVYLSASVSVLTGMPWYYHAILAGLGTVAHKIGVLLYSTGPLDVEDATVSTLILPFFIILSYLCDNFLRADFKTQRELKLFGRELDREVRKLGVTPDRLNCNSNGAGDCKAANDAAGIDCTSCDNQSGRLANLQHTLNRATQVTHMYAEAEQRQSWFLASMSHELRSPLTAMLGCSELLMEMGPQDVSSAAGEMVDLLYSSGKHLLAIVNDILDFSKLTSQAHQFRLEPVAFDPRVVANTVLHMFSAAADKKNVRCCAPTSGCLSVCLSFCPFLCVCVFFCTWTSMCVQ